MASARAPTGDFQPLGMGHHLQEDQVKQLPQSEVRAMLARGVFQQKYDYATGRKWVDVPPIS